MLLQRVGLLLMCYFSEYNLASAVHFTKSPRVRCQTSVYQYTLEWRVNEPVNGRWSRIRLFYDRPIPKPVAAMWDSDVHNIRYGAGYSAATVIPEVYGTTVGFILVAVTYNDTKYNYRVELTIDGDTISSKSRCLTEDGYLPEKTAFPNIPLTTYPNLLAGDAHLGANLPGYVGLENQNVPSVPNPLAAADDENSYPRRYGSFPEDGMDTAPTVASTLTVSVEHGYYVPYTAYLRPGGGDKGVPTFKPVPTGNAGGGATVKPVPTGNAAGGTTVKPVATGFAAGETTVKPVSTGNAAEGTTVKPVPTGNATGGTTVSPSVLTLAGGPTTAVTMETRKPLYKLIRRTSSSANTSVSSVLASGNVTHGTASPVSALTTNNSNINTSSAQIINGTTSKSENNSTLLTGSISGSNPFTQPTVPTPSKLGWSPPYVSRMEPNNIEPVVWHFNTSELGRWSVIRIYYDEPQPALLFAISRQDKGNVSYGRRYNASTLTPILETDAVGFRKLNAAPRDAKYNYRCVIETNHGRLTDSRAWFIYFAPPSVTISQSPALAKLNGSVSFVCLATSRSTVPRSLPAYLLPSMVYTWRRKDGAPLDQRHNVTGRHGNVLIVSPVRKDDVDAEYICGAKELGATLKTDKVVKLNAQSKVDAAKAAKKKDNRIIIIAVSVTVPVILLIVIVVIWKKRRDHIKKLQSEKERPRKHFLFEDEMDSYTLSQLKAVEYITEELSEIKLS